MIGFISSARKPPPVFDGRPLMSELKQTGYFWLPDDSTQRLWGRLHYVPGDTTILTLDGNITRQPVGTGNLRILELHGRLSTGASCVIRDVWGHVETFVGETDCFRSNLHAELLLIGLPTEEATEARFDRVAVKFSHLNEWFDRPLKVNYERHGFNQAMVSFEPEQFSVRVEFEGEPVIVESFCERGIPTVASTTGLEFTFDYKLFIISEDPQSLDWYLRIIALVRPLLMFLLGNGVYTLQIEALFGADEERSPVHVFPRVTVPLLVRVESSQFNVRHDAIRNELNVLLEEWFAKEKVLAVVRSALSDLLTVDGLTPEAVFIRIVQTMEHLHGIVSEEKGRYVSRDTWSGFCDWLDSVFPGDWEKAQPDELAALEVQRGALLGRIRGVNSLTLRSRLRSLFDRVPVRELMPVIDNPSNAARYLDDLLPRIEATRHYLTHFSAKKKEQAFAGKELERASLQCWAVLLFTLARFLGVSEEIAGDIALAGRRAMFLVGTDAKV
jgi:hypothetical protein